VQALSKDCLGIFCRSGIFTSLLKPVLLFSSLDLVVQEMHLVKMAVNLDECPFGFESTVRSIW